MLGLSTGPTVVAVLYNLFYFLGFLKNLEVFHVADSKRSANFGWWSDRQDAVHSRKLEFEILGFLLL